MAQTTSTILNFIGGDWQVSSSGDVLEIVNPATAKTISAVPLSTAQEVDQIRLFRRQTRLSKAGNGYLLRIASNIYFV
jgi:acyl-CoA reductase-like NAD-dependent aldehyde dehydrogenase